MRYEHDCFCIFTACMRRQRLFNVMLHLNSSPPHSNQFLLISNSSYVAIVFNCTNAYVGSLDKYRNSHFSFSIYLVYAKISYTASVNILGMYVDFIYDTKCTRLRNLIHRVFSLWPPEQTKFAAPLDGISVEIFWST